eukprot:jgi/Mesvir1/29424/Mv23004-RA.1
MLTLLRLLSADMHPHRLGICLANWQKFIANSPSTALSTRLSRRISSRAGPHPAERDAIDMVELTKTQVALLPLRRYQGPIHLVDKPGLVATAVNNLSGEQVLGFDTETKPRFRSDEEHYAPSLLQLASQDAVYVFQLSAIGFPPLLADLLAARSILKVGVQVKDDVAGLNQLSHLLNKRHFATKRTTCFRDLAVEAREKWGMRNPGLRGLTASFLGFRISKRQQTSNWAARELSANQLTYAATDAWVSREIFLLWLRQGLTDMQWTPKLTAPATLGAQLLGL